jgi:hypothetical protein
MKNKKAISLSPVGIFLSYLIASRANISPPNFPLAVFTVACTVLVAAIAFPQIAIGLSGSHIARNLIPEFYKNWKHWLFVSFQAFIAIWAIFTEHFKSPDMNTPCLYFRILLFLIVFDFFVGFLYLDQIRRLIASPKDMLNIYLKRLKRILRGKSAKARQVFFDEIDNIGRIGRYTTMCYEKTYILNAIENLLKTVMDKNIPSVLNPQTSSSHAILPDLTGPYAQIPGTPKSPILVDSQFEVWKQLVGYISEACTIYNEKHSANEKNALKALEILKGAWRLVIEWKKGDFDYNVCTRAIKEIANFSIKKGFDSCVEKAVEILADIAQNSISNKESLLSSEAVTSNLTEIGISAVKDGKDHLLPIFIVHLLCFFELSQRKEMIYLLDILYLMSITWGNNRDALIDLQLILDSIDDSQIQETVKFGTRYDSQKTIRIERFLKAVGDFKKPGSSGFIKKLGKFLKTIKATSY